MKINLLNTLIKNKNCLGFIWRYSNNKYGYITNDKWDDDLNDYLNYSANIVKKISLGHTYYVYQIYGGWDDYGLGLSYNKTLSSIKSKHPDKFDLSINDKHNLR